MGAHVANWIATTRDVYFGNATAVRDFRVQLRGNRSVLLFGLYLAILIGVAVLVYSSTTGMVGVTIVDAQRHLSQFYQMTMSLLGLTVTVVAPGLTATTIVMERQRQSIDLVFSAPVSPKYYLVGKMISSFRYTWMLLVLALPVASASVVLGGASWSDVLVAYILLSLQGLILTAMALLMSAIAPKPVGAIIWSYSATILYNFLVFAVAQSGLMMLRFGHGAGSEAPMFVVMSPWSVAEAARTYTTIAGHAIPNWIFMLAVSLLISKICLLGAGVLLSPAGGKEVVGLRIYGLIYMIGLAGLLGWVLWPTVLHATSPLATRTTFEPSTVSGIAVTWASAPFLFFLPFLSCFGFDREMRYRPNGMFRLRHLLDGTPAGGLPFLLAMLVCLFGGFSLGGWYRTGVAPSTPYWIFAFYATTFWLMFWSLGRLISSAFGGLKSSRTLVFTAFVLFVALPYPFLVAATGIELDSSGPSPWDIYVLGPIIGRRSSPLHEAILDAAVMLALSVLMCCIGEMRIRRKLATVRNYDEQPFQAA